MALAIPRPAIERLGEVLDDPEVVWRRLAPSLPIQAAVDIAVPISVVWRQLIALETLPEGLHQVTAIRRRGRRLIGVIEGRSRRRWRAEVTEERPEESFAWRSHAGSDCAGLITVHRLSERLTRLELTLDLAPCSPAEALALSARVAQRRTDRELRELKARLELISPDDYETLSGSPD